jgi:hypothetical protein
LDGGPVLVVGGLGTEEVVESWSGVREEGGGREGEERNQRNKRGRGRGREREVVRRVEGMRRM